MQHSVELKESWLVDSFVLFSPRHSVLRVVFRYEKLGRWDEALEAYETKQGMNVCSKLPFLAPFALYSMFAC
jgi:hypothetical protein